MSRRRRYGGTPVGDWDNEKFVRKFTYGGLGRKRQYGNLYVVDRENGIQVLMKKSTCHQPSLEAMSIPTPVGGRIVLYARDADAREDGAIQAGIAIRTKYLSSNVDIDVTDTRVVDLHQRKDGHKAILIWMAGELLLWDYLPKGIGQIESTPAQEWVDPEECKNEPILFHLTDSSFTSVQEARESLLSKEVIEANAHIIMDRVAIIPTQETIPELKDVVDMDLVTRVPCPWDYGIPFHLSKNLLEVGSFLSYGHYDTKNFPAKYKAALDKYKAACEAHKEERKKISRIFPQFEERIPVSVQGFDAKIKCLKDANGKTSVLSKVYRNPEGDLLVLGAIVAISGDVTYANCWTTHKVVPLRAQVVSY
jgi:hypothetical protein